VSSFTFLHAADLHLDSPLRGLDPDAPGERIRRATRDALVNMVNFARNKGVAFVLLAGDLYDGDWRDWRTGQFLVQQIGRLVRDRIEVVAISGNHDAEQVLTRKLVVPGLLGTDKPGTRLLERVPVAVHGQGFDVPAVTTNLSLGYPARIEGLFNIGLLHTACGSSAHENYAPCSIEDLVRHGYDYWALGHVHTRAVLSRDPWIVFPGNIQGRHINEEGSRGAMLVTVQNNRVASAEHHALDVLRWQRLEVDATGAAGREAVLNRARVLLDGALLAAQGRMLVVRVTLTGYCPAHADLVESCEETLNQIRGLAAELGAPDELWIESVVVATQPALDLEAMRAQPGAIGSLIEALERAPLIEEGLKVFVADQLRRADGALPAGHPALEIAAGRIPARLVEQARALVLAELARR
jgi:DNA repair exonuclease SbcCD nuclease subunit